MSHSLKFSSLLSTIYSPSLPCNWLALSCSTSCAWVSGLCWTMFSACYVRVCPAGRFTSRCGNGTMRQVRCKESRRIHRLSCSNFHKLSLLLLSSPIFCRTTGLDPFHSCHIWHNPFLFLCSLLARRPQDTLVAISVASPCSQLWKMYVSVLLILFLLLPAHSVII